MGGASTDGTGRDAFLAGYYLTEGTEGDVVCHYKYGRSVKFGNKSALGTDGGACSAAVFVKANAPFFSFWSPDISCCADWAYSEWELAPRFPCYIPRAQRPYAGCL